MYTAAWGEMRRYSVLRFAVVLMSLAPFDATAAVLRLSLESSTGAGPALRIHLEPGAAFMLTTPQREWFGPGGGATGKLELAWGVGTRTSVGLHLAAGCDGFSGGDDPRGGRVLTLLLGPRFQYGPVWVDAGGAYVSTGKRNRPGFGGTVGVEFTLRGIGLGPFVAYRQVVQPDTATAAADARYLIAGVFATLGRQPRRAAPPPPLPAPPPPPPPPPPPTSQPDAEDSSTPDSDRDVLPAQDDTAPRVYLKESFIEISQPIHFLTNRAKLRDDARPVLNALVEFLRTHVELKQVLVAGFADERGPAEFNQDLSERRAANVVLYLVRHGIARERLVPRGYGSADPVAIGQSPDALARNRRVQFKVLQLTVQQEEAR
jgi:outer membrane protein OmpA-like peptidoglycan-associated protein